MLKPSPLQKATVGATPPGRRPSECRHGVVSGSRVVSSPAPLLAQWQLSTKQSARNKPGQPRDDMIPAVKPILKRSSEPFIARFNPNLAASQLTFHSL